MSRKSSRNGKIKHGKPISLLGTWNETEVNLLNDEQSQKRKNESSILDLSYIPDSKASKQDDHTPPLISSNSIDESYNSAPDGTSTPNESIKNVSQNSSTYEPCETAQDFEPLIMLNMQYVVGQDNESFWKSYLEADTCTESGTMAEPRTKNETGTINKEPPIRNRIEKEILSNGNEASQQNCMEIPYQLPTQSHDVQSKISLNKNSNSFHRHQPYDKDLCCK